ncbi:hypothetical protein [Dokdonella soli]|uniref:Uncharacterized protein n=1 Tax=Dokdonella soli TaxID=529810 RepID=A0ABN1IFN0_9GAMM
MRTPFRFQCLVRSLVFLGAVFTVGIAHAQQRKLPVQTDRYGYRAYDSSSAQCPAQLVDMSSAAALNLVAASSSYPARDEGAAAVPLSAPFQLFGAVQSALVASSNGYLAAAASVAAENGADYSSACPLPAIASNGPAAQARILVYHDDLSGETGNGTMRSNYFASCPRPSDSGVAEACTVVDWSNWGKPGTSGLSMQAVLYHQTWEIALQYRSLDPSAGAKATIGVQDPAHGWGFAARCGGAQPIPAPGAICLFDPRYPPGSRGTSDLLFKDGFDGPLP